MDKPCTSPHSVPLPLGAVALLVVGAIVPLTAAAAVSDALPASDMPYIVLWPAVLMMLAATLVIIRYRRKEHVRSRAEKARQAQAFDHAQLLDLLDLSSDWLWETDRHHRYTLVTDGLLQHAQMDPNLLLGHAPWELEWDGVSPEEWERYRSRVAQKAPLRVTLSRRDRNGRRRHLELIGRPIQRNGSFEGYRGVGNDVTDRIEAERALHESRARYQEVVESINEVIFRTDAKGRLTFLNHAWETVTSHPVAESLGKPLVDYLHPDDRVAAWHDMSRVRRGEVQEYSGQLRLRTLHGEVRWIEATARPVVALDGDGEIRGVAGTLDDISERKVAEMTLRNINQELEARVKLRTAELEASNRELEAFSYSVSHDLRAPLRAIEGFARILEEELGDNLDPSARSHLERIRKASKRMANLIDDLIELARLTRRSLHKETCDLSEIATQVIEELRAEDPERNVEVEITSDLIVTADRSLMRVVLENLLRNAWKFSAGKEVARIAFLAERERDRRVFCVSDNGAGFDMAFAGNLFRPFHRLHNSAEFSGTGIGLANVQRIIQRHGGRIWADAKPNAGANFYFTLGA